MATIKVNRGNDYLKSIPVTYKSTGDAVNLIGKKIRFTVKDKTDKSLNDNKALIVKDDLTITDATGGTFELEILATDTEDMKIGDYYCDFRIIDESTGKVQNTSTAIFSVTEIITKENG